MYLKSKHLFNWINGYRYFPPVIITYETIKNEKAMANFLYG